MELNIKVVSSVRLTGSFKKLYIETVLRTVIFLPLTNYWGWSGMNENCTLSVTSLLSYTTVNVKYIAVLILLLKLITVSF